MPTVPTPENNSGLSSSEITPEEAARVRAAVAGKEVAPSSRQQSMLFDSWREAADQLGSPFEVERIPISKLRAMRRDPMLGFGLSFIKTPHLRAKWHIEANGPEGPNAQVAAHLDANLRKIYPSFVIQFMNSLDFGFQAIAKRFTFERPPGTYIEVNPETGEEEERPIWDEGNIDPIGFKPFVAFPPEVVEPNWNNDGEFDGIRFTPSEGVLAPPGTGASKASGGAGGSNGDTAYDLDVYHSLWVTNEKEQNFGSIFGYSRLGYAYRYWWSYWFRWAIADRAFERKADPSVIVRHPEGSFVDEDTGETLDYGEYALLMGERMRSGGVIALPSEMYEDANGRGTMPLWDISFTKDATNFDPFDKSFDYLDIQKLRSLFIPEQAFLEGKGGTSSRNVAAEMGDSFTESQAVLASQMVDTINRYIIPQWIAVNYPEYAAEGGTANFVMEGFADEDVEFSNQIIQMIGQQESGSKEILKLVDLKKVLEARGTPIASFAEQQRREQAIADEAAAAAPPPTGIIPGTTGVVPTSTGFAYVADRSETIHLSESGTEYLNKLPNAHQYEDNAVKGFSRQIWTLYRDLYRDEYDFIARQIAESEEPITLSDIDDLELADVADLVEKAKEILRNVQPSKLWPRTLDTTSNLFTNIAERASRLEIKRANLRGKLSEERLAEYIRDHMVTFASGVAETSRSEVQQFIAQKMREGVTDRAELATATREHFDGFPEWKADRLARTETRDLYNAGTLLAAESVGVELVQATDGDGDEECASRDGKIFTVDEALKEDEHPNGTLGFKILPIKLSVETVPSDEIDGKIARIEGEKVIFSDAATDEQRRGFLKIAVEYFSTRETSDDDD